MRESQRSIELTRGWPQVHFPVLEVRLKMGVSKNVRYHLLQPWRYKARRPESARWICRRGRCCPRKLNGGGFRTAEAQRDRRRRGAAPPHGGQCPLCCQQAGTSGFFRRTRGEDQVAISDCRGPELRGFARCPGICVRSKTRRSFCCPARRPMTMGS